MRDIETFVPKEYSAHIVEVMDWHSRTYMHDKVLSTRIPRIIEELIKPEEKQLPLNEEELYIIAQCISDAISSDEDCGVEKDTLWKIREWADKERKACK